MVKKRTPAPGKSKAKKKVAKKKAVKKQPVRKKTKAKKKASPASKRGKGKAAEKPAAPPASSDGSTVVDINRGVELSISQVSLETGFTRETVSKRLTESGVQASGKRRGYPVYRMRDILPALYQSLDGETDPDKLKPFERRAFYQGELDKLKLQAERGELVPSFEVERQMARLFKLLTQRLDTLPDLLERDVGATPMQLVRIEQEVDKIRESMYLEICDDDDADSPAQERA